jgi:hypothetical protein
MLAQRPGISFEKAVAIGRPDLELGGYRVAHEINAMVYLGSISAGVRTFSDWAQVRRQRSE